MRHVAIVGSGPAGYYAAEALGRIADIQVDVLDRLPVPYGLIRFGVAPDHQSIKAVARRYEKVALSDNVRFVGGVAVGDAVSVAQLMTLYDAVVLATGAPNDRPLAISGADRPGAIGSAAFVGWYNGHPDYAALDPPLSGPTAAVVGNGNVALDVARILAKTRGEFAGSDIAGHALNQLAAKGVERVVICGRRGPHNIAMTPKELGELGQLHAGPAPSSTRATCRRRRRTRRSSPASANRWRTCAASPRRRGTPHARWRSSSASGASRWRSRATGGWRR